MFLHCQAIIIIKKLQIVPSRTFINFVFQEKRSQSHLEEVPEDGELEATGDPSATMIHQERDREREDRIGAAALNRTRSINRQRLVAHSTAMESIQAESEPIDEEDDVP